MSKFKDKEIIYAWDPGNECNCMSPAPDRFAAENRTSIITNAIKACDNTRPFKVLCSLKPTDFKYGL